MQKHPTVLIVDDEQGVRQSFGMVLKDRYQLLQAATAEEAMRVFRRETVDLILLDILLPDASGLDLLDEFRSADPDVQVIMVTAVRDVRTAVKAIKRGAFEYIIKPFDVEEVLVVIQRAMEKRSMQKEITYLRNELERIQAFEEMVGQDPAMQSVFEMIDTVASAQGTVLIQGESGTGKELVARAIHNRSPRRHLPFVVVNCAAIPTTLMESELFGHTRGAFTGATVARPGKLEIADTGTVFLDDIDSLEVGMQAKLLRLIQEKEFERLGSNKVIHLDVRFIAATNKNLTERIEEGAFREDLFYRLNVFPISLPPLRARTGDIPLLIEHFLKLNAQQTGRGPKVFSEAAVRSLESYHWPGNVRELQNLVERLYIISKGNVIHLDDISPFRDQGPDEGLMPLKKAVGSFEKHYIKRTLDRVNGSRQEAAKALGIHRNTLLTKINELDIET